MRNFAGLRLFATATFSLLFVLIVPRHERRRIVHIGTTAHPTAAWVAQQIREAFPWDTAPRYLIRDRDGAYGQSFRSTVMAMVWKRSSRHHEAHGRIRMWNA